MLKKTHGYKWAGHPGQVWSLVVLHHGAESYFSSKMEEDVEAYIRSCLVCQQDKTERRKRNWVAGALAYTGQPIKSVSMGIF